MTFETPNGQQAQPSDELPPVDGGHDDYFARLLREDGSDPSAPKKGATVAATMLFILSGSIAAGALALTLKEYFADRSGGFGWQLVLFLTGPMFVLSAILGCIGLFVFVSRAGRNDGRDLYALLRASNGTPPE